MTPPLKEILRSLYGAYRLARADAGGMTFFNISVKGFWRSFFAAVIIAPLYILLLYMRFDAGEVGATVPRYVSVEVISYVIAWTAFPVVMLSVVRFLEREKKYLAYIIAYNWAAVLQNGLYIPLAMLSVNGMLSEETASSLSFVILSLILVYTWFITKTALELPTGSVIAIVALDLVLGVFISVTAESIL